MDVASRAGHLQIEAKDPPPAFPRVARKGFKVLAFLILAAASAHAGASVIYDPGPLLFTTTNQSMWGTGNATVISKSVFLGPQWTNQPVSQVSGEVVKPSPHRGARAVQVALQVAVLGGSQVSDGGVMMPSPQTTGNP